MDVIAVFVRDLGPVVVFLLAILAFGIALASPLMLVSVVLNVARIRRALERIADASEGSRTPGGSGVLGI